MEKEEQERINSLEKKVEELKNRSKFLAIVVILLMILAILNLMKYIELM